MNALTDEALILALVRAGRQGVKIDLIVRGACMLPAQVPGVTDNIRVRSIIGRFLEHSGCSISGDGAEELYLSSADWMNRNMLRRVELAWPVTDPVLRQRIIDECLVAYLHDGRDAWGLAADTGSDPGGGASAYLGADPVSLAGFAESGVPGTQGGRLVGAQSRTRRRAADRRRDSPDARTALMHRGRAKGRTPRRRRRPEAFQFLPAFFSAVGLSGGN
jgi:polyphosphate kinase